ncbi:hypothetical protein [Spirillospora sp. NPDC029432]|uniref:hypothetical protein n=1 Tax=Spirillospora sp. NPDC029432 TaxID=3154599 RepID=UPI0034532CB2
MLEELNSSLSGDIEVVIFACGDGEIGSVRKSVDVLGRWCDRTEISQDVASLQYLEGIAVGIALASAGGGGDTERSRTLEFSALNFWDALDLGISG